MYLSIGNWVELPLFVSHEERMNKDQHLASGLHVST